MSEVLGSGESELSFKGEPTLLVDKRSISRLVRVSKKIVSLVGANRAAIHQVMCDRAEKATLKTTDGRLFFFSPVERQEGVDLAGYRPLQDELPWLSGTGIREGIDGNEEKGLVEVLRTGNGYDRVKDKNGRTIRKRTHRYFVEAKTIEETKADESLYFDRQDACKYGVNAALVLNIIRYRLALLRLSDPRVSQVRLSTSAIQECLPVGLTTIKETVAYLVREGKLIKEDQSLLSLRGANPLDERLAKWLQPVLQDQNGQGIVRDYISTLVGNAERKHYVILIEEKMRTSYMWLTKRHIAKLEDKYFKAAAEKCYESNLLADAFLRINLSNRDGDNPTKRPSALVHKYAEQKYHRLKRVLGDNRTLGYQLLEVDLLHYQYLVNRYIAEHGGNQAAWDSWWTHNDPSFPAWFKLVLLTVDYVDNHADTGWVSTLLEQARQEIRAKGAGTKEALMTSGYYWQNLYRDELAAQMEEERKRTEKKSYRTSVCAVSFLTEDQLKERVKESRAWNRSRGWTDEQIKDHEERYQLWKEEVAADLQVAA